MNSPPELAVGSPPSQTSTHDRTRRLLYSGLPLLEGEIRILVLRPARSCRRKLAADLVVETLPLPGPLDFDAKPPGWRLPPGSRHYSSQDDQQFWNTDSKCCYSRANRFEALSYVWGGAETPCSITVNNIRLPIGRNLYTALRHLRSRHRKKLLWVDAICINQGDAVEKAVQVAQMSKVYARAWRVTAWLGSDSQSEDGRLALAFLSWFGSLSLVHSFRVDLDAAVEGAKMSADTPELSQIMRERFKPRIGRPSLAMRTKLLSPPTMSGVSSKTLGPEGGGQVYPWEAMLTDAKALANAALQILQEVALGGHKVLHVGNHSTSWTCSIP